MTEFNYDREGAVYLGWQRYKGKSYSVSTTASTWREAKLRFKCMGGDITGLAEEKTYD